MVYNIHPIFVHFPIAFLFAYSVIKILPLKKWFANIAWQQIERVLLVLGVLGAFASLSTGEVAEHLTRPNHQLVETHSFFATLATWLYGLVLGGEILSTEMIWNRVKMQTPSLVKALTLIKQLLTHRVVVVLLIIAGLVAIVMTGLLGGVLVYGTTADPLAEVVLNVLGIKL